MQSKYVLPLAGLTALLGANACELIAAVDRTKINTTGAGGSVAVGGMGGTGGMPTTGGGGTGGDDMCDPADCNDDNDCTVDTCEDGTCTHTPEPLDTACTDATNSEAAFCNATGECVECNDNSQCASNFCDTALGACSAEHCNNDVLDGDETGEDCGGSCPACDNGLGCNDFGDCLSGFCDTTGGGSGGGGGAALGVCAACGDENDCQAMQWCNTADDGGTCTAQGAPGTSCTDGIECLSGFCPADDNVCCDAACDGVCEACTAAKTGQADGVCDAVTMNTDPDTECSDQGAASCGANGTGCNGNATSPGCNLYPSGTTCDSTCTDSTSTLSTCNGTGTCNAGSPTACPNNLVCNAGETACLTQCTTSADCISGFFCDTSTNVCMQQVPQGVACNNVASDECVGSNQCVDGVCCNSACAGPCEACNLLGFEGTCTDVPDEDPGTCGSGDVCCGGACTAGPTCGGGSP